MQKLNRLMVAIHPCLVAIAATCLAPNTLYGQSQIVHDYYNDWGDGTVQTFVAESNDSIAGVNLVVFGYGNAADVTVQIRDLLSDGTLDDPILATGVLQASEIPTDVPNWRFITFETPLPFSLGENYGLVINQFDSGPTGFNEYGSSLGNPYSNGVLSYQAFGSQQLTPLNPEQDLAFFFTVPEPASIVLFASVIPVVVLSGLRKRRTNV